MTRSSRSSSPSRSRFVHVAQKKHLLESTIELSCAHYYHVDVTKATGAEKPIKKIRSKGAGQERAEIEQTEVEIGQSTGKSALEVGPMTKEKGTGAHLTIEVKDEEADRQVGAISEEADHMTIEVENVISLRREAGRARRL